MDDKFIVYIEMRVDGGREGCTCHMRCVHCATKYVFAHIERRHHFL